MRPLTIFPSVTLVILVARVIFASQVGKSFRLSWVFDCYEVISLLVLPDFLTRLHRILISVTQPGISTTVAEAAPSTCATVSGVLSSPAPLLDTAPVGDVDVTQSAVTPVVSASVEPHGGEVVPPTGENVKGGGTPDVQMPVEDVDCR